MKTHDEIDAIVQLCTFENYRFYVYATTANPNRMYLQAAYLDKDIVTGMPEEQHTRKWLLSPHMTKSEIVQTVFKCCLTSMEHRTREAFQYRGKRVFGPHFDVDRLWELCADKAFDYRTEPNN